ncbi:MAG TPA: PhzF family phenazine biosynthesis protein [Sphingomicrobium sp.]|nr:PhzF family phenazine biosynthesis protein [Sphingomicrobium sp.]
MTPLPIFQVDAFAEKPFTGNPAAVMPLDHWLPDEVMQAIAAENNLSETAFTVPSERDDADYDLRWFTPMTEVPLCGHATFAAAHILIKGPEIRFSTQSGVLTVTRDGDMLQMSLPAFTLEAGQVPGLLEALRLEQGEVHIAEGAEPAVIILLPDEQAVRAVNPDFKALKALNLFLAIVTAPGTEQDIASRVFCPSVGIDEDPVTGAAHAALVPFWADRLGRTRFTALQASKRTGLLDCELRDDRVILGGHAVTVIEGHFQI